jgi:iron complex outermembrane receptor protein
MRDRAARRRRRTERWRHYLGVGLNNAFDEDPPICLSCSLNGYDAFTYDVPGMFWYVQAGYRF